MLHRARRIAGAKAAGGLLLQLGSFRMQRARVLRRRQERGGKPGHAPGVLHQAHCATCRPCRAGVVSDTMQQTTDSITDVGRRTWTTARETSKVGASPPGLLASCRLAPPCALASLPMSLSLYKSEGFVPQVLAVGYRGLLTAPVPVLQAPSSSPRLGEAAEELASRALCSARALPAALPAGARHQAAALPHEPLWPAAQAVSQIQEVEMGPFLQELVCVLSLILFEVGEGSQY